MGFKTQFSIGFKYPSAILQKPDCKKQTEIKNQSESGFSGLMDEQDQ